MPQPTTARIDLGWADVVTLRHGPWHAEVLTWGGHLLHLAAPDRSGAWENAILRLPAVEDYRSRATNPWAGSIVGRCANRIAGAAFTVDDTRHALEPNDGPNLLHGGPVGLDQRRWVADSGTDAGAAVLRLRCSSPDGDHGFPGTLDVTATYRLEGPVLSLTFRATCDAPTPVNLTSHPYYNLGGPTLAGHRLTVAADTFIPTDEMLIPTGTIQPVAGGRMDFRAGRDLTDVPAHAEGAYDDCLLLNAGTPVAAALTGPTGRQVRLRTDQPALQVFTAAAPAMRPGPATHVCMEAQGPPDAVNQPHLGDVVLRPGQALVRHIDHDLEPAGPSALS